PAVDADGARPGSTCGTHPDDRARTRRIERDARSEPRHGQRAGPCWPPLGLGGVAMNTSPAAPAAVSAPHPWEKDDLKRRIRLHDLVEHHGVVLRRDGAARWKALCPFHEETDPSFTIFAATDTWKCFGCGRGGDIFHFLWHLRGA